MPPSPTAHTKGEPLPPLTSQSKDVLQKNGESFRGSLERTCKLTQRLEGLACGELTSTLGKEPMAEPQTPRERTDPVAPPTTVEADSLELPTGAHESLKDTSQNQQAVIARIDGVTIKSPLTESSDEAPAQKRPEKTATPVVPSAVSPAVPSKTRTLAETKQNTKAVAEITDVEDADSDRGPPVKPKKQAPPSGSQKRTSSVTTIPEPDNDTEDDDRFIILPGRKKKLPVSAVNAKDRAGRTLLFKYASQGLLETVESLIRVGAQINVNDYAGWSPLHEACNEGHEDVVRLLLAHGADPNIQGGNKDTPLHDALQNGHLGVIQLLLAHGSSLEALNEDGETPLDVMGSENDDVAALVSRWKEKTAQVTEQDAFGQTALHRASKEGNAALVKECLEHGSDVHAVDNSKWTALHEAALNGHVQVCSLLLSHSASVDAVGLDEDTPLHSASINSHAEVVELLLKYGAKRSLKDVNGKSPRDLASAPDVQLLLDAPPSAYKPFLKPIFGPAPLPQVNQSQQQADDESIDSDARIGGASGEQLMDWSYSNQSAGSDAKASSSKAAFSWGGLDPQRGTFESTREERKFQALLKKLEEADGEKSVSTPSSPQIVEHQKSLKSKTDTTPVKERKHKRDSSVSKKRGMMFGHCIVIEYSDNKIQRKSPQVDPNLRSLRPLKNLPRRFPRKSKMRSPPPAEKAKTRKGRKTRTWMSLLRKEEGLTLRAKVPKWKIYQQLPRRKLFEKDSIP